jgi:diguanylate cyclase (GGDEF)-like protein/PAS domain S-box-containing protein
LRAVLKLLIVGPDDLSLELSSTVLWRPDIERTHVADAGAAITAAADLRPNLVVLASADLEATLAFVRALRADPRARPTAIAVLSRGLPARGEDLLLGAGANAVLPNPVDPFLWDPRLEELLSVPRRRYHRIPVRLRDWSGLVREAEELEGEVVNIGARGVLLESPAPLELGAKLGLSFRLPGDSTDVQVVGQVVRPAGGSDGRWRTGVEFLVYRGDARDRIVAFVESESSPDRPGAPASAVALRLRSFEQAREWEEELRGSELRKTIILDSAIDCIITVDQDGRVIEFNASARRLFGHTRAEVFGRDIVERIVRPEDRDGLRRLLREFVETGDADYLGRRCEAQAMRADGSEFPVEVEVFPAWIKGKVLLTAFLRDLTDRKRTERVSALRHGCTRVLADAASPVEALPHLCRLVVEELGATATRLWLLEPDGARLSLAATWPSEGASLAASAPCDIPKAVERVGRDLRVPMRAASRSVGYLEVETATKAPLDAEWLEALQGLASQIGLFVERHWAEEALRQGQAGMAAVADAIPGAVYQYEVRPDGKESFTFMSRGAIELFGVDTTRLREEGSVPWTLVTPEHAEDLRRSIAASAASLSPWEATFEVKTDTGLKWIHGQSVPSRLPNGGIVWNGIFVDVSAQKAAEAALLRVNDDLDRRLADLRQAETELQRLARYDSLTGLPNRSFFMESLDQTLLHAERRKDRLALVFIDVDGFKTVNDSFGHAAGDLLLRILADRLRASTRKTDTVARIGGDEFTVMVQDLGRADYAAVVAQSLLEQLARPCLLGDREVTITASVGISVFPEDGTDGGTLLKNADLAMYRAKQEGKNGFRFFTASMSERARERMLLQSSLRHAVEVGEFEMYYQPLVHGGGPPSLEALIRWRHPERGLVSPADFIPAAEEGGLILTIGAWVLRTATAFAQGLARSDVRVAVNLSARQFLDPDLVTIVEGALRESGLAPGRLELEVTESAVMSDAEEVSQRLEHLRSIGLELTLDDFGSGYSSLGYLKRFQFHRIKIDRTFVRDLPADGDSAAIVDAILAMAKSLGLEVVAEGVETVEQLRFLQDRGCRSFQGYYFSHPLPAAEVAGYLARPDLSRG